MPENKRASVPYSSSASGANRSERLVRVRQHIGVSGRLGCTRGPYKHRVQRPPGCHLRLTKGLLVPPRWRLPGCPSRVHRQPVAHEATQRGVGTHIKVVVAPHLDGELFANPGPHLRPLRVVEPAAFVDLANNPLAPALLGEDPAKTGVVGRTPENERDEKEAAGQGARPEEE